MAVPIREDVGEPGADRMGGNSKRRSLQQRRAGHRQHRQRKQHADQDGNSHQLPVIGIGDRTGPREFQLAAGVEKAPIRTDAAFENLPGLIEGFDQVVVDAERLRARHEIAHHLGLLEGARICGLEVIAGARPTEFRDDDALARISLAQLIVDEDRLVDGLRLREAFPIGKDMSRDEIHRRSKFRMFHPDVPDFAGCDRYLGFALYALDALDKFGNLLLAAKDGFVADYDAVDIVVAARELDDGARFAFVARFVLVDPGADCDAQSRFLRKRRHKLDATGRRVSSHRASVRREQPHVGPDACDRGPVTAIRM